MKNGVCGVEFDRKDIPMNKFLVTCLEAQMHAYDARTQHPAKGFASVTAKIPQGTTVWGAKTLVRGLCCHASHRYVASSAVRGRPDCPPALKIACPPMCSLRCAVAAGSGVRRSRSLLVAATEQGRGSHPGGGRISLPVQVPLSGPAAHQGPGQRRHGRRRGARGEGVVGACGGGG